MDFGKYDESFDNAQQFIFIRHGEKVRSKVCCIMCLCIYACAVCAGVSTPVCMLRNNMCACNSLDLLQPGFLVDPGSWVPFLHHVKGQYE